MLELFREFDGSLTAVVGGRTRPNVKIVRAAPLSDPNRYISVVDANGEEVCMINDPLALDEQARHILHEELERQSVTLAVRRINALHVEPGISYLDIDTDRGPRDVVLRDAGETVRFFGKRLLLVDVDGNRFEIPDVPGLDTRSAKLIRRMLQTQGVLDE
jgi:hypothetical protein